MMMIFASASHHPQPQQGCDTTPLGLCRSSASCPRVAAARQPWAGGHNAFGVTILVRLLALLIVGEPAKAQAPAIKAEQIEIITRIVDAQYKSLLDVYQDFHRNPELSLHEVRTAKTLAGALTDAGFDVTTGVGGQGVVALLKNGAGPTVMIRTDLDALPVRENTGLPYASTATTKDDEGQQVPVMHACGHDVHITSLIGVARVMSKLRDTWSGTLMLIGQPAEEGGTGARSMLKDGLFTRFPKPDFALAMHVDATIEAGKITYSPGYITATADSIDITVRGRGGHGSAPHTTIDPIVTACRIVVDLQTIVAREIDPQEDAVVTVGSIHGGSKRNIIPDEVKLQLTVRTYKDDVRKHIQEAIKRIASGVAESAGAPKPTVTISEGTPATYNDPALVARCVPVFEMVIGKDHAVKGEPVMGSEDFSRYGQAGVPIFMFRLGSVSAERLAKSKAPQGEPLPSLHSALFAPVPEPTIKTGVRTMSAAALNLLIK